NRDRLARRPVFQGILAWEIFRKLYDPLKPPAFSTFFTNQVAGVMHRYWDQIFPEDFGRPHEAGSRPHLETLVFALRSVDEMLGDALRFCEMNPELMAIFASSMGQGPVSRKEHEGFELSIPKLDPLLQACGLAGSDFSPLLAMVPQICARIPDQSKRNETTRK